MKESLKRIVQNTSIIFLLFIAVKDFIISLPFKNSPHMQMLYYHIDMQDTMFFRGGISLVVSVVMILLAFSLMKRVRAAWMGEILLLTISIALQSMYYQKYALHMIIFEFLVLVVLLASADDFTKMPARRNLSRSLAYLSAAFVLFLLNITLGVFLIHGDIDSIASLKTALGNTIEMLFFFNTSFVEKNHLAMTVYTGSMFAIFWIQLFIALIFVLRPFAIKYFKKNSDLDRIQTMLHKGGQNPMSYLALEDDKQYFFGTYVEGVCAYTTVGNVMVVCGDPICEDYLAAAFINEIMLFVKKQQMDIVFLNVTDANLEHYKNHQFGIMKYGEDACFQLSEYELKGGAVAKVRAAINRANREGVQVLEYEPLKEKNELIESEMNGITDEWMKQKNMPEMKFMLGGLGLEDPRERRYFYAVDSSGVMQAFVVFLPYEGGRGYLADVTRRKSNATQGSLEKIIYMAFMKMKEEGVIWGNMGLSPLYNVSDKEKASLGERISNYIYENLNEAYDFKSLHHSKEKYAPTHWIPRYIVYYPRPITVRYAYAIVRAQNPTNLFSLIKSQMKGKKD